MKCWVKEKPKKPISLELPFKNTVNYTGKELRVVEYITLNNGVEMPVLGYGTYQTPSRITEQCVTDALRVGYRSIDTAQCYGNEQEVGLACRKSGIARSELFITT